MDGQTDTRTPRHGTDRAMHSVTWQNYIMVCPL